MNRRNRSFVSLLCQIVGIASVTEMAAQVPHLDLCRGDETSESIVIARLCFEEELRGALQRAHE